MSWTEEKVKKLKDLWGKGNTASEIAEIIGGVSRNAVIGKAHRMNLSINVKDKNFLIFATIFDNNNTYLEGYRELSFIKFFTLKNLLNQSSLYFLHLLSIWLLIEISSGLSLRNKIISFKEKNSIFLLKK